MPSASIEGLLATVVAMKQLIEQLAGQLPVSFQGQINALNLRASRSRYTVTDQKTVDVKITSSTDPTQFIVVRRTYNLVLRDNVSGAQWTYTQPKITPGSTETIVRA